MVLEGQRKKELWKSIWLSGMTAEYLPLARYNSANPLLSNMISKVENTCVAVDSQLLICLCFGWMHPPPPLLAVVQRRTPTAAVCYTARWFGNYEAAQHVAPSHKQSRTRLLHLFYKDVRRLSRELNRKTRLFVVFGGPFWVSGFHVRLFFTPTKRLIHPTAVGLCEKGSQCDQDVGTSHI